MGTLNVTSTSNGIMEQLRSALSDQFSAIAPFEIVLGLVLGLLVGLLIAFVYKRCFRGVLYSPSFAMTLAMLTLITTPVVMCIKSNIALSMGMVGALSIVRFRTAVKDPLDTAYMFWSLTRRPRTRAMPTTRQATRSSSRRRLPRLSSCSPSCISRRRTPTCSLFTMMKRRNTTLTR